MTRRSDIVFFGTITIVFTIVMVIAFFGLPFPKWLTFWWIILLPLAISKMLFPKSKLSNWMNTEIKSKK